MVVIVVDVVSVVSDMGTIILVGYLGGFPCTGFCPVQDARLVSTGRLETALPLNMATSLGLLFAWKPYTYLP